MKGISIRDDSRRATAQRIVLGLIAVPLGMFFAVSIAGAGNWPLGGLVAIPSLYLVGVLLLDVRTVLTEGYRTRPRYLAWWALAVLPALSWLIWLVLSS